MGNTPDTARQLAVFRRMAVDGLLPNPAVEFLLDHIDTLTAKLAEAESERDALRHFAELFWWWRHNEVTTGDIVVAHDDLVFDFDALKFGEFLKRTTPEPPAPSPVEGGQ
jgi:hypothetical protein